MMKGLMTLSTVLTRKKPQAATNTAQPSSPCWNSQMAAPPHTNGGPTGTTEKKKVTTPSSMAAGTPAIRKPMAASTPWARAVPKMP